MSSVTTKKRFIMKQAESELYLPNQDELIARVLRSPGRNLHEVEDEKGDKYLVSMPRKFRETIYIKRDNFVFVTPIEEGIKVKAEITQILDKENILYIREQKIWPKRFESYAESITREAKRGIVAGGIRKHDVIDEDMLPSSDTDDNDDDDEEEQEEEEEEEECENETPDLDENGLKEVSADDEEIETIDHVMSSGDEESDCDSFKVYNPNRLKRL